MNANFSQQTLTDAISSPHAIAKYAYKNKETNETFCEPDDILLLHKKMNQHMVFAHNIRTGVGSAVPVAFLDVKIPLVSATPTSERSRPDFNLSTTSIW